MFIRLTAPNGTPVDIDPKSVEQIFQNEGLYHPDAKTVLITSHGVQAVKESFFEVETKIKG